MVPPQNVGLPLPIEVSVPDVILAVGLGGQGAVVGVAATPGVVLSLTVHVATGFDADRKSAPGVNTTEEIASPRGTSTTTQPVAVPPGATVMSPPGKLGPPVYSDAKSPP